MPDSRYTAILINDLVDKTWLLANEKAADFSSRSASALASLSSVPNVSATTPSATITAEPAVLLTVPTPDEAIASFDEKYLDLVDLLASKFTSFQSAHFPTDDVLYESAMNYLAGVIADPDVGLPPLVAAQMLADDKARILADAGRATDAAIAAFAARRFPLPPGAAASAVIQIQNKAQDAIAESGRKLTMISIEQMKFAVTNVTAARQTAMSSSLDYIKSIASATQIASGATSMGYDAQSKMLSAVTSFYGARTEASKIVDSMAQSNAALKLKADESNQSATLRTTEERSKMILSEAAVLGQMSSALFNNLHTGATASITDSTSEQL
jgi:hypothetical protein